jgi:hypothetical protein
MHHRHKLLGSEIGASSVDWAQLSRFYLKTETESSLWIVVFWKINGVLDKDRTLDNVQKHNIYIQFSLSILYQITRIVF